MVSWGTIKALVLTLAPLLLPRLIGYVRSVRRPTTPSANDTAPVRPVPPRARHALNILFVSAALALVSTLSYFAPENIFTLTKSRVQTATDVIFTRLDFSRDGSPGPDMQLLRQRFVSLESRLLYFAYGPDPLAHCGFCNSDEPLSYLYYALPSLLTPHLLHLIALGAATSPTLSGREASLWRTQATVAAITLAVVEVYLLSTYNHKLNLSSVGTSDIDFFHWRLRVLRGLGIAITDLALAGLLFLSATNRAFVSPPSPAARLETATRTLEQANRKLHALGVARNAVLRDDGLRRRADAHWVAEGRAVSEVFEEREVVDGVRGALTRMNVSEIADEAGRYADSVVGGLLPAENPLGAAEKR
ncbi:MAG: hypothetical protein M1832_000062 [Thelocarpon impressellum]|nr:MAG: hypothetical protein M1832_000062 [Thelocarpon impressellum]